MLKKIITIVTVGVFVISCIDPYELDFSTQREVLFINADLNDVDSEQFIVLKKNIPNVSSPTFVGINNATVKVIENNTKEYKAESTEEGNYKLPNNFKVNPNSEYVLEFKLENGAIYRSAIEKIDKVPSIDSLYYQYASSGINYDAKTHPGHKVYLNTNDTQGKANYYKWSWRLFERQYYCKSCDGGRYFNAPLPLGRCVEDANLRRRGVIYDYNCSTSCWDIIHSSELNIMSDDLVDGGKLTARNVANVPYLQLSGALLEVSQYNISKTAYNYFKLMISQGQNTGTLADTPPAGLIGNVKNINDPTEPVGGIFMVSSKTTKTIWISREDVKNVFPYGLLKGRQASPEPSGTDTTRPPLAPCVESNERTAIQPPNWVN